MRKWTAILICILWVSGTALCAHADESERLVRFKAVFIYNFISYMHWPDETQDKVFKIGILGDSPLEKPLREISKKRSSEDKKLQVEVYRAVEDLEPCHVLFISSEHVGELDEIMQRLEDRSVLTIADTPGLANRGVTINFVLVKGKLKFEINQQALQRAGLRASAQLLKLAILVKEEDTG